MTLAASVVPELRGHVMRFAGPVSVFTAPTGGPLHAEYWRDTVWRPAGAGTGLTRMRPHDLKHAGVAHLAAAPASTRGRSRGAPVTRIPASPSPLRPPLPRGPPQRRSASPTLSADDCAQPTVSCGLLPRPRVITDSVPVLTVITEWLGDLVVAVFSQGQARSTGSPVNTARKLTP